MFFSLFSGLFATCVAALITAPEDIPTRRPSVAATFLVVSNASSFSIVIISSKSSISITLGMKPAPIPWILCGPGFPPDNTADDAGSTAIILTSGLFFLSPLAVPVIVPPVPTEAINSIKIIKERGDKYEYLWYH